MPDLCLRTGIGWGNLESHFPPVVCLLAGARACDAVSRGFTVLFTVSSDQHEFGLSLIWAHTVSQLNACFTPVLRR
jgi:hypothetical protein